MTLTDLLEGEDVTADLPDSTFNWAQVHAMQDHTQSITYSVVLRHPGRERARTYTNVVSINGIEGATDDGEAVICSPGVAKTSTPTTAGSSSGTSPRSSTRRTWRSPRGAARPSPTR